MTNASLNLSLRTQGEEFQLAPRSDAIPPGRIQENSDVVFHLVGDEIDLFGSELLVDGEPLERVALAPNHLTWRWRIGFNAGQVDVQLRGVPSIPRRMELTTDPHVAKLTRADYARMVGDILADTLALFALTGHRLPVARGPLDLQIARFEYLASCLDRAEAAVVTIDKAPWRQLGRTRVTHPLCKAGGATSRDLARALCRTDATEPALADQLSGAGAALADRLGGRLPKSVTRSEGRLDNHRREHSDILAVLSMWESFLSAVRQALPQSLDDNQEAQGVVTIRRKCTVLLSRLRRLKALPLFEGIRPTRGPIAPSHLFRRVAPYRQFYSAYQGFLDGLANIQGDFLNLPLRRTFDLYEMWCFLRLAHAAANASGVTDSWRDYVSEAQAHGGLVLRLDAKPMSYGRFRLIFKPLYREVWKVDGPRVGSFSRVMQPDVAIEVERDGQQCPTIVLDAKYRVDEGIDDAIASIHMYAHALVDAADGISADGIKRTVAAAFVLTPRGLGDGPTVELGSDRAPAVFYRGAYKSAFRFGAVEMRPGIGLGECEAILAELTRLAYDGESS